MEITDTEAWEQIKKANRDPYGSRIVSYAEAWANLMETRLAKGETVKACVESTRRQADTDAHIGTTGFMYGAAVSILSRVWAHGDALCRWHR